MASGCFEAISPSDGNASGSATANAIQIPMTAQGHRTTTSASRRMSPSPSPSNRAPLCDASPVPAVSNPSGHRLHGLQIAGDRFLGAGIVRVHDRHDRALSVPEYVDRQLIGKPIVRI